MTETPYEIGINRTTRRALAEQLPAEVAFAVAEFFTGALAANPRRVGKPLEAPYEGVYSARVMQEWRVLYTIDDQARRVSVRDVRHRRDAYRPQ
ncbi:type II toxin-antitoxin system RelE/ParE family toxin [Crossiella sp. SN42]|uniref:type II toxin-antitoxin system RelE family toxin n=1 Tax=Crossiella sp. SN42 TaxID=2944808 RepID=UPI00207D4F68|nr:type II toxin-antitoxin system RelE/ParE family toxin [Crossiella sp. SN42]MCO1582407.1 type II toxin-antitoxin system RelE/ParE family toxin [Crossiella sp. SN42]